MDINKIKKDVIETGINLLNKGYVSRTWGNISCRVDEDTIVVTPSGRTYTSLNINDIVVMDIHTGNYEGTIKPTSEAGLHLEIYKTNQNINAVIHTHQVYASTVAAVGIEIPPILDDMAQIIGPTIRVAEYALPGTKDLVDKTLIALKDRNACLLANHGTVCVGRDLDEAFAVCEILEKTCKVFINAKLFGGAKSINMDEAIYMHEYYKNTYSKNKTENTIK